MRSDSVRANSWDGLVIVCAGKLWNGHPGAERPLAEHLADHVPVLYADPPISRRRVQRDPALTESLKASWPRVVRPGLAHLPPIVLAGKDRLGVHVITDLLVRQRLRAAARRLTTSVRAVVNVPPHRKVFGACGEDLRICWALDDYVDGALLMGVPAGRLRRGVAHNTRTADVIVAASPDLGAKFSDDGYPTFVVPNGCDAERFAACDVAPLPADVTLRPPIAGFMGQLSERVDFSLLDAVAQRGQSLLLVGPAQRTFDITHIERLLARPNVCWVGAKPFDAVASYLRLIDVGLVPYSDTQFNRASFPLKTLEYLAAGRAVVATDLPAMRWLGTDLIATAMGPRDFAVAVDAALALPRTPRLIEARRALARDHDWSRRAARWAEILRNGVPPGHGPSAERRQGSHRG